jgi:streptogrisin D
VGRTVVSRSPFRLVIALVAALGLLSCGTSATVMRSAVQARPGAGAYTGQLLDGDQISNGIILCTVGFNVTRDGANYILTAGHCTAGMRRWRGLGPSVAANFPGSDFGLIRNDSYVGAGAIDMYDNTVQPITRVGAATVGERVCASGEATGVTCGKVLAVDQTVDYGDGNIVHGLIETDIHTDHGDSGGPLFDGDVALGTVSGGDGQIDYFQPLAPELAAYGLQLVRSGG